MLKIIWVSIVRQNHSVILFEEGVDMVSFSVSWRKVVWPANFYIKMNHSSFHFEKQCFKMNPISSHFFIPVSENLYLSLSSLVLVSSPLPQHLKGNHHSRNTSSTFQWLTKFSYIVYAVEAFCVQLKTRWITISCSVPDMANFQWPRTSHISTGKVNRKLRQQLAGDLSTVMSHLEAIFGLFTRQ